MILYTSPRIVRAIVLKITLRVVRLSRMNGKIYEWEFNGGKNDGGSRFEDIV